ncbi:MAG TPA: hypothetical protein VJ740_04610 [Hyphomicrobiaceae bacterium]|nr:hypothetical protein [Hyphomicrobiaceae bacterium]
MIGKSLSLAGAALAVSLFAAPATAAPAANLQGIAKDTSAVEQAHYRRRCWWHHGHRHCRRAYYRRHYYGYYPYRHYYGYRPGFSFYFGPRHRHWHHRHWY